jgi:thioredoxin-like negative regulator of GroEL
MTEVKTALDELIGRFETDLKKDRDNERSRVFLCKGLALRGDVRTAADVAEEGLKLNPKGACGEVLAELMTARAVQVRTAEGLTDAERAAVYRRALELLKRYGRDSTVNDLKLAELARLLHDDGEVERRLLKAVESAPAARLQLADFYVDGKRPEEAQKQWLRLVDRYAKLAPAQKNDLGERLTAATAALRLEQFDEA